MTDVHIFICYSSKDESIALEVVGFLERRGIACWISQRDVEASENYQSAIVRALESAKGIVFLFSESSAPSGEVTKELSIAGSLKLPVFPLRLSPITPTGALRYELATRQWVDFFPDQERALTRLADTIERVLAGTTKAEAGGANTHARVERAPVAAAQPASRAPIVAAGSEEFEAIRLLLARHIGPIAKVLVQKAAAEASSPGDFGERLAAHLKVPGERAAFVQAVQARLGHKA
jgi:TIR domain